MLNSVKEIYNWQVKAGNADQPYDDFLESAFQVEEALEGFDLKPLSKILLNTMELPDKAEKVLSREVVIHAQGRTPAPISDVERLDKACDAIVYAIGSIAKLGLDHHGITKALNIVNKSNMTKLGMPRDEHGKLLKPDNFVGPEPELQALLDARDK